MGLLLEIVRWLIAVPAGLIFALCALGNWLVLLAVWVEHREGGYSFVLPFFGPAFGLVFFFSVPLPGARADWWVALVADPITLIGLAFLLSRVIEKLVRSWCH